MLRLASLHGCVGLVLLGTVLGIAPTAQAQLVPGTGNLLNYDDLEDQSWSYVHNLPKSSKEEDETIRFPLGASNNRMWSESPKRGSPDVVKRIETPAGGLVGSTGSLYLRTRDSGIPGRPGYKQAQDDFILAARPVAVSYSPNFVVRVFLPEFSAWEQRQGVSFGIRAGMQGIMTKQKPSGLGRRLMRGGARTHTVTEMEPYYPGFFIAFNPVSANPEFKEDHAQILLRSDGNGHEVAGPKITQTGWWTFGMSVTPDSRCHYYAHAGIADLTAADFLYSSLPYGIPGDHFNTIFFNVCSADNASNWSTPWIIDDPKVFYSGKAMFKPEQLKQEQPQQAQQEQPLKTAQAQTTETDAQNASLSREVPAPMVQAPVVPGSPVSPLPAKLDAADPEIPPVAPAETVPMPLPVPAAPMAPVAPTTPSKPAPEPSAIKPIPRSPAPALLSTNPAATVAPVQAPQTAASSPMKERKASGELKGNPFDNARKPNTTKAVDLQPTIAASVTTETEPSPLVAPPQEDAPLLAPVAGDLPTEIDPVPVPLPPSD